MARTVRLRGRPRQRTLSTGAPARGRRGLPRALAVALADAAGGRGVRHLVTPGAADDAAAHALYSRLGFRPASRHAYWTAPAG
ncbi:GNAT family N-acetyltransferase [Leifsonia sp. L25]|uniref:GNAT family N-acetyltransferase n=1 Tax=Actinomycetes TaxID=1760 RepID=UPI003D695C7A